MQQHGEILRQVAELVGAQLDLPGGDAPAFHLLAAARLAETGDPPHVVILGERLGDRRGDLARGAGDEDLLAFEHVFLSRVSAVGYGLAGRLARRARKGSGYHLPSRLRVGDALKRSGFCVYCSVVPTLSSSASP